MIEPTLQFQSFGKIPRWSREICITEKIDGTNAQVAIFDRNEIQKHEIDNPTVPFLSVKDENGYDWLMIAGSRKRWISKDDDNYGFGAWVSENREELVKLGPGRHYGEWWGKGIQGRYNDFVDDKRFSLFNVSLFNAENAPECCLVVPIIYNGLVSDEKIWQSVKLLKDKGSIAAPGCMNAEGIMIYHIAGNCYFKKTLENDQQHKTMYTGIYRYLKRQYWS